MSTSTSEGRLDTYRIRMPKTRYGTQELYWWINGYRTGSAVLRESISIKGEQCQQRILKAELQWSGDEERSEAAVQTEEGPNDIQTGAIPRLQIAFREADQAIRNAYDTLTPREAVRAISTIWEQLDRTSELAAARSRLLIGKLVKPQLASLPDWFENQRDKLSVAGEGEAIANPDAVAIAELLVRAALAAAPGNAALTAEIETGPMGRVIVDWCVPKGRLQWMVEAIDIPWPSVKVYQVLHRSEHGLPKSVETRIFYNAFDAIDSFIRLVGNI